MATDTKAEPKPEQAAKGADAGKKGKPQNRSPSHPLLSLEEAIQRARTFYKAENFTRAAPEVALAHWGYGAKSSSGLRTLAALLHYGLLNEQGVGKDRRVWLSERAKTILLNQEEDDPERNQAIRDAALTPKIYKTLWEKWSGKLPSDSNMGYELVRHYEFNPASVPDFIKDFKATVEFAKLVQDARLSTGEGETPRGDHAGPNGGRRDPPPLDTRRGGGMPDIQRTDAKAMDFPIPLLSGGFATLRLPVPLSKAEYTHFKSFLAAMLTGMEQAVTREPPKPDDDPNGRE